MRFALAAWFTLSLSPAHSDGPVAPARYALHDPVPPPTEEDEAADGASIDALKARIERMFG